MENSDNKEYTDFSHDTMIIRKEVCRKGFDVQYCIKCKNEYDETWMIFNESDMKQIANDILEMLEE